MAPGHVAESAEQHDDQSLDSGAEPHERRNALFLMPSSTPATPAMPEPMMKVISTTRLTSTPSNAAVSWFSAVARMARPSLAALDEEPEQHHQRHRHAEDEDLHRADGDRPEAIELLRDGLGEGELLAAEEIDREILQDDREADGADQRRQRSILAHRADRNGDRDGAEQCRKSIIAPKSAT